jgi:histidyl-tRNA synthetase
VEQGQSALTAVAELRKAGFAADTDLGGRSLKGQLSYGSKRARATVIVTHDGMTLRRPGELDVAVDLDELRDVLRA